MYGILSFKKLRFSKVKNTQTDGQFDIYSKAQFSKKLMYKYTWNSTLLLKKATVVNKA